MPIVFCLKHQVELILNPFYFPHPPAWGGGAGKSHSNLHQVIIQENIQEAVTIERARGGEVEDTFGGIWIAPSSWQADSPGTAQGGPRLPELCAHSLNLAPAHQVGPEKVPLIWSWDGGALSPSVPPKTRLWGKHGLFGLWGAFLFLQKTELQAHKPHERRKS